MAGGNWDRAERYIEELWQLVFDGKIRTARRVCSVTRRALWRPAGAWRTRRGSRRDREPRRGAPPAVAGVQGRPSSDSSPSPWASPRRPGTRSARRPSGRIWPVPTGAAPMRRTVEAARRGRASRRGRGDLASLDRARARRRHVGEAGVSLRCRALLLLAQGESEPALAAADGRPRLRAAGFPLDRGRALLVPVRRCVAWASDGVPPRGSKRPSRLFSDLGAPLWLARAEKDLRRASPRPRRDRELTTAERRVAALVAPGRTNREVAAQLFTTVGTVEAHLTRIYRKLDVRSRTELARRVADGTLDLADDERTRALSGFPGRAPRAPTYGRVVGGGARDVPGRELRAAARRVEAAAITSRLPFRRRVIAERVSYSGGPLLRPHRRGDVSLPRCRTRPVPDCPAANGWACFDGDKNAVEAVAFGAPLRIVGVS